MGSDSACSGATWPFPGSAVFLNHYPPPPAQCVGPGRSMCATPMPRSEMGLLQPLPCLPSAHFLALCPALTMISLSHALANVRAPLWKFWLPSPLANVYYHVAALPTKCGAPQEWEASKGMQSPFRRATWQNPRILTEATVSYLANKHDG